MNDFKTIIFQQTITTPRALVVVVTGNLGNQPRCNTLNPESANTVIVRTYKSRIWLETRDQLMICGKYFVIPIKSVSKVPLKIIMYQKLPSLFYHNNYS